MTVCKIGRNTFKINLTDSEVKIYFGSYDNLKSTDRNTRIALGVIISETVPESELIDINDKIVIRLKAITDNGCEIIMTRLKEPLRNKKNEYAKYIFDFTDSESMIRAILFLYENRRIRYLKSDLYKVDEIYRLAVTAKDFEDTAYRLGEFCSQHQHCENEDAFADEHGNILVSDNAIDQIGRAFFKGS